MYNAAGQPDKEELVQRFVPLVKRIAHHLMARLPASVLFDDLFQNGMLGLLDAIERFEEGLGAQFETYATQRIKGAMLDGLRDWLIEHDYVSVTQLQGSMNLAHVGDPGAYERDAYIKTVTSTPVIV